MLAIRITIPSSSHSNQKCSRVEIAIAWRIFNQTRNDGRKIIGIEDTGGPIRGWISLVPWFSSAFGGDSRHERLPRYQSVPLIPSLLPLLSLSLSLSLCTNCINENSSSKWDQLLYSCTRYASRNVTPTPFQFASVMKIREYTGRKFKLLHAFLPSKLSSFHLEDTFKPIQYLFPLPPLLLVGQRCLLSFSAPLKFLPPFTRYQR